MSLIKPFRLLVLLAAGTACGPEGAEKIDVLFGTYGELAVGISNPLTSVVRNFVINEDGTFVINGHSSCGVKTTEPKEYKWVRHGDDAIDVLFPDAGEGGIDTWRISRGADCNQIRVDPLVNGESSYDYPLARGEVCLEVLPPCPGSTCNSCGTVWCDGPPSPCDEAAR